MIRNSWEYPNSYQQQDWDLQSFRKLIIKCVISRKLQGFEKWVYQLLQHFCSSTFCLQQGRGSTLVSLFRQKLLWRHNVTFLSKSFFNISSLSLPSHSLVLDVLFTAVVCIPMSYKSPIESSCSRSSWYALYILLCFDICASTYSALAYSYNHAVMLALNHGISRLLAHVFSTSIELFKILHVVSKISKSFRQSNSRNCSFGGVSCLLFSLTWTSSHRIAIITPTITIVMGCDESGKPMESSSPQSQINTRLLRPGYDHVCSNQWQGNSLCVDMMLLQLRFPDASSSGSTSIITRWTSSFSSTAL